MNSSSATIPPMAMRMSASISDLVRVHLFLRLGVGQETERGASFDDRKDFEVAFGGDQPGGGGVARLVGGDGHPLALRVGHGLGQAQLGGHLGLLHVVPIEAVGSPPERPHQRLVEEVLEHHRRVAEGGGGQAVAPLAAVQLGVMGLAVQVVVENLPPSAAAWQVDGYRPVEAPGAQ